jgi:uracil-DNA glycosylase family 4
MEVRQGERLRWQRPVDTPFTLDDAPQVMGLGPDVPVIHLAIMGEAPGADEEAKGEPFVGRAGNYLNWGLKEAGIYRAGCYLTNVVDRRPPDNNIASTAAKEMLTLQRKAAWDELRWLSQRGLRVVLALGKTAASFFGINEPLNKVRGSIYEVSLNWEGLVTDPAAEPCDFVVVPTYHPAFLMRGGRYQTKNDTVKMDVAQAWLEDLKTAHRIASQGYTRPVERFIKSPTFDQVVGFCQQVSTKRNSVALDIETSGFSPTSDKIICIGMATSPEDAICVPLYRTGENVARETPYWTPSQLTQIKRWLERVFAECPLVLQNAVFDVGYLQQAGWAISPAAVAHDTMLLHHAIASELPHNLGFITSVYGHTPYWKGEFLTRDKTIWEMDFDDLQVYNMRDCIVLHQVLSPMLADLDEIGSRAAYDESLSLIGPVIEMQQTGVLVNKARLAKWKASLEATIASTRTTLYTLGALPDTFNVDSNHDVLFFLYSMKSSKHTDAANYTIHKEGSAVYAAKKALHEMVQAVKPLYVHGYRGRSTKSGMPALDKKGLTGLRIHLQNRRATLMQLKRPTDAHNDELIAIDKLLQWLTTYSAYKEASKLMSFADLPIRRDGRIHPSLLIHGTATGRLSCSSPNMQQIPKIDDGGVRACLSAPIGHYILAADYNNLEFMVMAYECEDPVMLRILDDDLNQHDENTKAMFNVTPDDSRWAMCRRAAKTFQFGTQYGGGDREVYEGIIIQVPEMNLTFAEFKEAKRRYEQTFRGWAAWRDRTMSLAAQTRRTETAFGRVRLLYGNEHDIGKQALNTPCQGGAAHIINAAMVRILNRLHTEGMRTRLQIQIHDELRFEVPEDELHHAAAIIKHEMELPVTYRERTVVFPVNIEYGRDWHNLEAYSGSALQ